MPVTPVTITTITSSISTIYSIFIFIIIITTPPPSSLPQTSAKRQCLGLLKIERLLMLSCQEDGMVQVLFEPRRGVELRALALSA